MTAAQTAVAEAEADPKRPPTTTYTPCATAKYPETSNGKPIREIVA